MTEELITALGKVEGLRVAARASSFAFKGKPLDVGQVSRALNVGAVLDGSVRRSGRRLRVTAELVDARDGSRLWADSYDRELRDVFRVQDELARAIVGALRVPLRLAARSDTALGAGRNQRTLTRTTSTSRAAFSGTSVPTSRSAGRRLLRDARRRGIRPTLRPTQGWPTPTSSCRSTAQYGRARRSPRPDARSSERCARQYLAEAHASLGTVRMYEYDWHGGGDGIPSGHGPQPELCDRAPVVCGVLGRVGRRDEALAERRPGASAGPIVPHHRN